MKIFKQGKWIWNERSINKEDDYVTFIQDFSTQSNEVEMMISCDSVYAVYLNDVLIKFMQCSDYPHYKFVDCFKLKNLKKTNHIRIDVWHIGVDTQCYYAAPAGLIFEIIDKNKVISFSSKDTLSRINNKFTNGYKKYITSQLGLSFKYDENVEENSFVSSVEISTRNDVFNKRDIHDLILLPRAQYKVIRTEPSILIDLGKETAGIIDFDIDSTESQNLIFSYGEHIEDGGVRRVIGNRDFSFEYVVKKGNNHFLNPLRRIAGRYIEIFYSSPIEVNHCSIRGLVYDTKIIKKNFKDSLLQEIYDKCVYTVVCCMHEHYEDCPWREQCLYSLDSRNQMLCGYYAFEGFEYQKHNLLLMAQDPMHLGLLSLCYPSNNKKFAIPMFSLTYIIQTYEYIKYSGDVGILKNVGPVLDKIANEFTSRIDTNDLIKYLPKPFWNFYEWTEDSDGAEVFDNNSPVSRDQYDLVINCMYVYAMKLYGEIMNKSVETGHVIKAIKKLLYNENKHLFLINTNSKKYSQFGNALAILVGLGDEITLKKVKECEGMIEASLSTRGFVYDALLRNGNDKFVLDDIKNRYKKMIDNGATTFYETEEGASAFDNAGSLCHGWSSLPIYYLNILEE